MLFPPRSPRVLRFSPCVSSLGVCIAVFPFSGAAQSANSAAQQVTIESGVPLHVRVTRTAPLRKGASVEGVLTEPVYVYDRLVLPKDAVVHGIVSGVVPAERNIRTRALLDGDVTPLHEPVVNFDSIRIGGADVSLASEARIRSVQMINFAPAGPRPSLIQQGKKLVKERIQSTREALFAPERRIVRSGCSTARCPIIRSASGPGRFSPRT